MPMTVEELNFLMNLIRKEFGFGYSDIKAVGQLQAKLSIMAEVAKSAGRHSEEAFPQL